MLWFSKREDLALGTQSIWGILFFFVSSTSSAWKELWSQGANHFTRQMA
jgi:hypothetical protein